MDYVYLWADGIHVNIRLQEHKLCLLVMIGVRADGRKELVPSPTGTGSPLSPERTCCAVALAAHPGSRGYDGRRVGHCSLTGSLSATRAASAARFCSAQRFSFSAGLLRLPGGPLARPVGSEHERQRPSSRQWSVPGACLTGSACTSSHASIAEQTWPWFGRGSADLRMEALQDPPGLADVGSRCRQAQFLAGERINARVPEDLVGVPAQTVMSSIPPGADLGQDEECGR